MGNHHQIISVKIYSDIVVPRSIHEKFQKRPENSKALQRNVQQNATQENHTGT